MRRALAWAVASFNRVCNIGLKIVPDGTIKWHPYPSNDYLALTQGRDIWWSTERHVTDIRRAGADMCHEICHATGFAQSIGWGHYPLSEAYHDRIMHPWGAKDRWWHPAEAVGLQKKFGRPRNTFRVWEIDHLAKLVHDFRESKVLPAKAAWEADKSPQNKAKLRTLQAEMMRMDREREQKTALWVNVPMVHQEYRRAAMFGHSAAFDDEPPAVDEACACCAEVPG